ncbi:Fic family protein [Rufibacter sediminis]|uniref:Fic family protein n=1 Tax=Rufibacter sediminis TaxID=2762756 RepID=A0ABR6VQV9_9BACT|nr:Fic family protein [Rufibacter sediminis]MBC3539584.1 Fic family protein [Rufibacter sediminis]
MTDVIRDLEVDKPYNHLPLLPPPVEQMESIAILKQESKAAVAVAELKGLAKTLPNQGILINAIVLKEAQASSEIENIITTHDRLYQAIAATSVQPDPATKEVLRYREALLHGFREIKERGFLNTNSICRIQAILEENEAGIRQLPGTALKNDATGTTIYTPPDDKEALTKLMRNLEEYLNEGPADISPFIRMAIQHYQFESIHPFYDGNGRTGRILNVLYLILHQQLDIPILFLSGYIIAHKAAYYRLLQEVRTTGNWEAWILYMLQATEKTARKTIEQINAIHLLFEQIQQKVKQEAPKIYSKDLIEQLFVHPYTKIEYITNGLSVERKAASRYLKTLQQTGVLSLRTIGKENIYINDALYSILRNS